MKTRYVDFGVNFEHATGGGDNVTVEDFTLGTFDLEGVDSSIHKVNAAFGFDARSGACEIASRISIGSGVIRKHGHSDSGDGINWFTNGGAIYIRDVTGITFGNIQFVDCHRRGIRFVGDVKAVAFGNLSCIDLVSDGGIQEFIGTQSTTVHGAISNVAMRGAAGTMFNIATPTGSYGLSIGETALIDGVTLGSTG